MNFSTDHITYNFSFIFLNYVLKFETLYMYIHNYLKYVFLSLNHQEDNH